MTANPSESPRLTYWLRRLWPLSCFLPALVPFGYAIYDGYQIDGDAVAYMVNFGIVLLEMLAVIAFTDALISLRELRETSTASRNLPLFLLDRYTLRYLG